jgi:hypothetical protein
MLKRFTHQTSARVKMHFPIKMMMLVVLVAALAGSAFGQTPSSTNTGAAVASMVVSAKTDPAVPVPAAENPISPAKATATKPVGAGSDNHGYVLLRGYFFSINRSGGDPAVINVNVTGGPPDLGGGGIPTTASVSDFDYGWKSAYKAEVGWNWSNNWGIRASYFYTNQSAQENRTGTTTSPFFISPRPLNVPYTGPADPGTLARFRERFQIHVIDVEGDYKWHNPNWSVLVSGGIRIAPSRQTYTAEDTFKGVTENLTYVQERTGYGPTGAIDFRHRIGGSNFWWTGAARVAALFGAIDEISTFTAPGVIDTATRSDSRTNWVYEVESGLEWSHKFNGGNNEFFLNGSFVYHNWNDIVNIIPTPAVGTDPIALLDNPLLAATKKGSISFTGGVFSVGFRF